MLHGVAVVVVYAVTVVLLHKPCPSVSVGWCLFVCLFDGRLVDVPSFFLGILVDGDDVLWSIVG